MKLYCTLLLTFCSPAFFAQNFRLEEIMKGDDFIGHSPENVRWSYNGESVYFDWNPNSEAGSSPYRYDLANGNYAVQPFTAPDVPAWPERPSAGAVHYFSQMGNLARYNAKTRKTATVMQLVNGVWDVQYGSNPSQVFFELSGNIYSFDETTGSTRQLTNFREGSAPTAETDSTDLMRSQTELFDHVRRERDRQQWYEKHQYKRELPSPIWHSSKENVEHLTVSPNGQFVTFRLSTYPTSNPTYYEEFITPSGFTQRQSARDKVSNEDPSHRFGIYDVKNDTVYYVSFAGLTDIRKKPEYLKEYGKGDGEYDKDRAITMHRPVMHDGGMKAVMDIRSYDNKDRWIVEIDLAKGTMRELNRQHDEAWIGGPGISNWNDEKGTLGWLDDQTIYFQSESVSEGETYLSDRQLPIEKGYSHLFTLHTQTGHKTTLTSGRWEVYDVQLSRDKQRFYIIANKIHPGVRNGYQLTIRDRKLTPLFEGNFGIEWKLSPDEKHWAIRYSTSTQPWDLYIADNKPGAQLKRITKTTTPAYEQLPVKAPEIVQIPTSDNEEVTARLYKPQTPNGAAVLFVHGAGYLQNAHHYWSYYCREFLFHQLLTEKGYTVLDIDYRASEGYGRDVRTDIYRHMGERDLLDYVDGKNYLVGKLSIDPQRVGIYGGSYGGFITLMGMCKTPGTFACGAALRSVTDWEHYNHEYTSNILNYPGTDPIAYKRSSPIRYAEGLSGPLLMLHGMEDDNVQFQDIVRMNQRFIELGKKEYQLAVFPTEAHGFQYTPAWVDEYRRILELFETHLK